MRWAKQTIAARLAGEELASNLGLDVGAPILYHERLTYTADDRPLEWIQAYYDATAYSDEDDPLPGRIAEIDDLQEDTGMSDYSNVKQQVLDATMSLKAAGCIKLSAGNISARSEDGNVAITPSGLSYDFMTRDDIVVINSGRKVVDGELQPSSEVPMHTAIYDAMPDVNAIVHTHSMYAITFACVDQPLEVICVEGLAARGPVPVARYAAPGSEEAESSPLRRSGAHRGSTQFC